MARWRAIVAGWPRVGMAATVAMLAVAGSWAASADDSGHQLDQVRLRIRQLEQQLGQLERESESAREEQQRLRTELELAEARVRELELVLGTSREEIEETRDQVAELARQLQERREVLRRHLEMIALLGRPGAMQLFYDAFRGGELDQAVSTVSVLTAAQLELISEYREMQTARSNQLAQLSRRIEDARVEADELQLRRGRLEEVRRRADERLRQLERRQSSAGNELAEMKGREEALERLLGLVRSRRSFSGAEDIRRYRGALPWPAQGDIVVSFGKHYLPKYATYTVCNGLRLAAAPGGTVTAVFPGEVAYARHFRGYGNMVVVDHGNGVYSLVAGLASIHVRERQRLAMGDALGVAAPSKDDGNLYVEIRDGETPQDPRRWLQLEGG